MASFGGGSGPGFGTSVRDFVRRYGWRAYALPLLLVITVVALLTTHTSSPRPRQAADNTAPQVNPPAPTVQQSSPPVAPSSIPLKSDTPRDAKYKKAVQHGALPLGCELPEDRRRHVPRAEGHYQAGRHWAAVPL